ncbi:MAG: HEPN domain-containing protein [Chitinispirillaceae bacterium]|nr:HEPN domain-containing protein [Chitinispirillaceae bacterium]
MDDELKNLVRSWLEKAEHDKGIAEILLNQNSKFTDGICFHCQQAAEKILKACLIFFGINFKKTHNLVYLLDLMSSVEIITDKMYESAESLEGYAVEVRYPDAMAMPSLNDAVEALKSVKLIELDIIRILSDHGL